MSGEPRPVFVARRTYHRRRMADAARLLPILGGGLFLIPLLWRSGAGEDTAGPATVDVMLYLFLVWVFLAGAAGLISRRLPEPEDETRRDRDG